MSPFRARAEAMGDERKSFRMRHFQTVASAKKFSRGLQPCRLLSLNIYYRFIF